MTTPPCSTPSRPVVTWHLADYHLGRDLIITLLDGRHCWKLAAARFALGLPAIGPVRPNIPRADFFI